MNNMKLNPILDQSENAHLETWFAVHWMEQTLCDTMSWKRAMGSPSTSKSPLNLLQPVCHLIMLYFQINHYVSHQTFPIQFLLLSIHQHHAVTSRSEPTQGQWPRTESELISASLWRINVSTRSTVAKYKWKEVADAHIIGHSNRISMKFSLFWAPHLNLLIMHSIILWDILWQKWMLTHNSTDWYKYWPASRTPAREAEIKKNIGC